jgi:hypothetical protein
VQNLLVSKIAEIEHAYIIAARGGNHQLAAFWNRELIYYLLRLHDSIRDSKTTGGTDSGEL